MGAEPIHSALSQQTGSFLMRGARMCLKININTITASVEHCSINAELFHVNIMEVSGGVKQ